MLVDLGDLRGQLGDWPRSLGALASSIPALDALAGSIWRPWALLARPGWFDVASSGPIWVPWALWLARFGRPGRSWLALAGQRLPHRRD